MKKSAVFFLGMTLLLTAVFQRDEVTGIVTDTQTGLQWQDNMVVGPMNWNAAMAYCDRLVLDGTDWMLPGVEALETIVDSTKDAPAVVDGFEHTVSKHYWSSTVSQNENYRAKYVGFFDGNIGSHNKDYLGYVRCVRAKK